jgi:hypothetical protein
MHPKKCDPNHWREWIGSCLAEIQRAPLTADDRKLIVGFIQQDALIIRNGPASEPDLAPASPWWDR